VIVRGYQESDHQGEAAAVLALMTEKPDTMFAPLARTQEVIAQAKELLPERPTPVDTAANTLSRYLHYRHNDLKVRWLVDQASRGGLDDFALETLIASEPFQSLEPARQPSIHSDASHMDAEEFAAFLFDRALPLSHADEDLLRREYGCSEKTPAPRLIQLATSLFLDFERIAQRYSEAQIQQGIWFLLAFPYTLGEDLNRQEAPLELRQACLEAMVVPFRDYLQRTEDDSTGAFFMWWDLLRIHNPDVLPVARRVMEKILQMRGWQCQKAALHGLNHLRPDWEASAIVDRYLENDSDMPPDELDWVKACRDGKAQ
jgi:hypothetical protein